jgi:hypothetical protein
MQLNSQQLLTLKAAVLAETDPGFVVLRDAGNDDGMAAFYNVTASPAYIVWKSKVTQDEIMLNGFDWSRVDNLSVGKARVWEWMFDNAQKSINPSKSNIRAGIDATWAGTAADLAVRAAVYVHCKRAATVGEKLFSTGVGTDAAPSVMAAEGAITAQNISDALRSN